MSESQKCPVCDGRGFVKGNFYDIAGETCSFSDYAKKQQLSTICMCCNGKGVANIGYIPEGEIDVKLKEHQDELQKAKSEVVREIIGEILLNHTPDIDGFFTMHESELAKLKNKYTEESGNDR